MLLDFSDITGHEKETLFIIGNGFDKAHYLNTSYSDFREWLMQNNHQDYVNMIESIFNYSNKDIFSDESKRASLLWKDFEAALGQINAETAKEYLINTCGDVINNGDNQTESAAMMRQAVKDTSALMLQWAKSISFRTVRKKYNMTADSRYLSFNYTLTLEKLYKIDENKICHIHGSTNEEKIIVGCERDTTRSPGYGEQKERRFFKKINTELDKFNKPVDDIIENNEEFFTSLKDITRVIVLGHSLSDIDLPYIYEVKNNVAPNAHWHFSAYSEKDYSNIKEFIENRLDRTPTYIFSVGIVPDPKINDLI